MIKTVSDKIIDDKTSPEEFVDILLKNRGLDKKFLEKINVKDIKATDFGVKQKDFDKAIDLIKESIKKQEKIIIYGDYDVDGITSTALVWKAIFPKNKNVKPIIPDRQKDGYGLNTSTVENYCQKNKFWPELLILVDNGIVAQKEIKKLKKKINKIIVIDHHIKNDLKNEADAVIHSPDTSASVLSFLVARSIDPKTDCELATLGLIGDMANLANVFNRNIAKEGIKLINQGKNIGVKKILEISGTNNKKVDEWTVGFVIGPRINASGRMGDATRALRLLSFSDETILEKLAIELEAENKNRQTEERKIMDKFLSKNYGSEKIIVEIDNIHPGIIGLLAGKLSERFGKPSIVVTNIDKDLYKGSARSIEGFDITKFLRNNQDLFESLGGHKSAAGFSIKAKNFSRWLKRIEKKDFGKKNKTITLSCDAKMKLGGLKIKNFEVIQSLRPFGEGNRSPLFLFEKLRIVDRKAIGKDLSHLKIWVDDPKTSAVEKMVVEGIGWGKNKETTNLKIGDMVSLVASLNLNEYMGKRQVELMVKEIMF